MLQQFTRLELDIDGRFATVGELQFVRDYLDRVEEKIATYEKIRDRQEDIVEHWETVKRAYPDDLFHQNGRDITDICRRDAANAIRLSANTMLFDDLDRLREGFLIWYQTIVKSFCYKGYANINYRLIQDVIRQFLTPEEVAMVLPAFQLEHTILGT